MRKTCLRPVAVVGEGGTHDQAAAFDPPVRAVDGFGLELMVIFGRLCEDEGDVSFEVGLVAFGKHHVVAAPLDPP